MIKRAPVPLERDILGAVLQYLNLHKNVAWATRFNVGAMYIEKRYVSFGFKGLSDIIGQLKDGRMLAVEVKRPGKLPTADQEAFMRLVNSSGGLAFWADDVFDVEEKLK